MSIPTCEEFTKKVLECNPKANIDVINKAYSFAEEIHKGQIRNTYKDDAFSHAVKTALIVLQMKLDSASIAAALLHNVLEYSKTKPEKLKELFGDDISKLVDAVTKFKRINFEATEEEKADQIRKVLMASAKDIRVILLKLADKLENMNYLDKVPPERRKELATEALEIYAPIAHKLGINKIKSELEDTALRHLDPEKYALLVQKVAETKEERERQVRRLIEEIQDKLKEAGIKYDVYGRAKSYYSIYKKLQERCSSFDDIHDLLAIRIIVQTTEDCYKTLGIIHGNWRHLPNLFTDYIANPKPNGYQSIHTKILYNGKTIEVQIRSTDMHKEAEEGIAAHWLYKGTERDKKFDKKISWLKQILEWQSKSSNAKDFIETLKIDLFKGEIIVFTPKGEPINLPEGSTPVDFAYALHSDLGNKCARAKVNDILVPLDTKLNSGDIVEILTVKNAVPSRHWLNFARTAHAKSKIRQALHLEGDERKGKFHADSPSNRIIVQDVPVPVVKFFRCCAPKEGDKILGFKTKEGKISVHKEDCKSLAENKGQHKVNVSWRNTAREQFLNISVKDKAGLVVDILNLLSKKGIILNSINTQPRKENLLISLSVKVDDLSKLEAVLTSIREMPDVINANIC